MSTKSSHTPSQCYYEVLQVERTATGDEIKVAYRKLALKWHPGTSFSIYEQYLITNLQIINIKKIHLEKRYYYNHKFNTICIILFTSHFMLCFLVRKEHNYCYSFNHLITWRVRITEKLNCI